MNGAPYMFTKGEVDVLLSVYTFIYERAPTFTLQEVLMQTSDPFF